MSERSDVYAYFWAQGFDCTCAEVTSQLAIEPSEARVAGDKLSSGRVVKKNRWEVRSPLPRGEHLIQEYLEALLPLLEAQLPAVKRLAESCFVGINCVGYYYGSNPGLHLSAPLIARLATLGLSVLRLVQLCRGRRALTPTLCLSATPSYTRFWNLANEENWSAH